MENIGLKYEHGEILLKELTFKELSSLNFQQFPSDKVEYLMKLLKIRSNLQEDPDQAKKFDIEHVCNFLLSEDQKFFEASSQSILPTLSGKLAIYAKENSLPCENISKYQHYLLVAHRLLDEYWFSLEEENNDRFLIDKYQKQLSKLLNENDYFDDNQDFVGIISLLRKYYLYLEKNHTINIIKNEQDIVRAKSVLIVGGNMGCFPKKSKESLLPDKIRNCVYAWL